MSSRPPNEGALPALIDRRDLRGDLHAHTTATDGRDGIEAMALAARDAGLEYLAITDHSQALAMANGLDERRALEHARRVREVSTRLDGITLLAGIECDIRADGTLDLAHDCLAELDYVVASIHSSFGQSEEEMTDRLLRAMECPWVDTARAPDRTHSAAARAAQGAAGPDYRRRCTVGRGTRDQLPGGPARSQRCQRAACARAGCEAGHRQRCSLHTRVQHAGVGRDRGTPRLGDIGRRPQYAAPRRAAGIACGATGHAPYPPPAS